MEIRQLRHLVAVVETGSLGRAAQALNISEPALSKSVRGLEAQLGVRLLDRSPRGMLPTVFGTALHRHARALLAGVASAAGELQELRGLARGVVRVGAQPSLAGGLLPNAIAELEETRPGLKVVAHVATTDLLVRLREGNLDFLLVTLTPELADPDFEEEFLLEDEVVVVAGPGSALAAAGVPSLDALLAARWVLPRSPDPLRLRFDAAFLRHGVHPPPIRIETSSETLIRACVERHSHASLLPRSLVEGALAAGLVKEVPAAEFALPRRVGIVRRRAASLSPSALALLSALRAEARRLSARRG